MNPKDQPPAEATAAAEETAGQTQPGDAPGAAPETAAAAPVEEEATATPAGDGREGGEPEDELAAAKRQAEETYDKYLRLQAEFENFKKRMHKEKAETLKYAQFPLLRELIDIMDNFERAVDHARANPGEEREGLISGIDLVIKQLKDTFTKFGMVRIEAVGKAFDPTCHEAMAVVPTNDTPENQVMEEVQSGYLLHDRVVRPARVTVSKPGESPATEAEKPTN